MKRFNIVTTWVFCQAKGREGGREAVQIWSKNKANAISNNISILDSDLTESIYHSDVPKISVSFNTLKLIIIIEVFHSQSEVYKC